MIGIVIPVHNEEQTLSACLRAAQLAARHADLEEEVVRIVVALDACSDGSAEIARRHGVGTVTLAARNVGMARALGAESLLNHGARWLAFTDADSLVWPDWLAAQLALQADAVCGTVAVVDWQEHGLQVQERFGKHYQDRDGHRHVHGANFGISAQAYRRVGGFSPLACDEDVAMVRALQDIGAHIAWSARPRVTTSARAHGRLAGGFADTLRSWAT